MTFPMFGGIVALFLISSIVLCARWSNAELYTALVDMKELLQTENVLLQTLDNYIVEEEHRLSLLKKHVSHYTNEHKKAAADPEEYLSNPVNAYLLVKRLTSDWKNTEYLMKNDVYQEAMDNLTKSRGDVKFPTDEDLNGAAVALLRLQDTYKLDTASVARGELNGIQYSTELTAGDCFELGRQSYNVHDHYHTILWMKEALHRYDLDRNNSVVPKWEILEYLAYSSYMQGNIPKALYLTDELLKLYPDHQRAIGNRDYYLKMIREQDEDQNILKNNVTGSPSLMLNKVLNTSRLNYNDVSDFDLNDELMIKDDGDKQYNKERRRYEQLCRKEIELSISVRSKLRCRYVNYGKPFLLLAPLKEEEAYLNPRILLFREAMYPSEINIIKSMAQPRLKRATVQNYKTGELEVANYRISKSAWLKESEHPIVGKLSRRIEDMTSLTTETAEELQVVNYGIGGHYEPHYDFARKEEVNAFKSLGTGNRIATVLFYMSNVSQGGATVFTSLDLALWPEEGTAAFWYNLHSSGGGDYFTRHAACPILQGSKWVSNKWLHEIGQEFLRRCEPADAATALL